MSQRMISTNSQETATRRAYVGCWCTVHKGIHVLTLGHTVHKGSPRVTLFFSFSFLTSFNLWIKHMILKVIQRLLEVNRISFSYLSWAVGFNLQHRKGEGNTTTLSTSHPLLNRLERM
jgi:hypothetical protein